MSAERFDFEWIKSVERRWSTSSEDSAVALTRCVAEIENRGAAIKAARQFLTEAFICFKSYPGGSDGHGVALLQRADAALATSGEAVDIDAEDRRALSGELPAEFDAATIERAAVCVDQLREVAASAKGDHSEVVAATLKLAADAIRSLPSAYPEQFEGSR